jgi:hypothetical protein
MGDIVHRSGLLAFRDTGRPSVIEKLLTPVAWTIILCMLQ